jgi:hypothetical protein
MTIPNAYGARIVSVDRQRHHKSLLWNRVAFMVDDGAGNSILHVARTLPGGDANQQVEEFDKTKPATVILNGRSQIIHVAVFEPDVAEDGADDEDGADNTGAQMSYKDALDYAIFAINTFMNPDASDSKDVTDLELKSDDVIATLIDMRTIVQGVS